MLAMKVVVTIEEEKIFCNVATFISHINHQRKHFIVEISLVDIIR